MILVATAKLGDVGKSKVENINNVSSCSKLFGLQSKKNDRKE